MRGIATVLGALVLLASAMDANAARWEVIQDASTIEFTGVQMGVPTKAEFSSFASEIEFDRDDLSTSAVTVTIELDSVTASYPVLAEVLRQEPWFNVAEYPEAKFEAHRFSEIDNDTFAAEGSLTLRGVTQPVVFTFTFQTYGPHPEKAGWVLAILDGEATVQRTAFGVGQGEWGSTSVVADEVNILVHLSAEHQLAP